jgi:hypothetical protein
MALLVSLIGLSAVAVGRANLRASNIGGDAAAAEMLATSAIEHAAAIINTDSLWRSRYVSDVELSPAVPLGRGTFTWKLVDEIDGNLAAGGIQPVRIWGTGRVGEARRCYSVVYTPGGTNQATNGGMEQGTIGYEVLSDSTLESWTDEPHNGAKYMWVRNRNSKSAGPQQDLLGKIVSGNSYYVEMWMKTTSTAEDPWLSFIIKVSGQTDTVHKVRAQTAKTEWTRVYGTLTPTWSGSATAVYLRVETNSTNQEIKLDDLKVIDSTPIPQMAPATETWRQEQVP